MMLSFWFFGACLRKWKNSQQILCCKLFAVSFLCCTNVLCIEKYAKTKKKK